MNSSKQNILKIILVRIENLDKKLDDMRDELKSDIALLSDTVDSLAQITKTNFDRLEASIFQLQMHVDARE